MLVLTQRYAFVGVWLQPTEFGHSIPEEGAALRRRLATDDLVVFETTVATHNPLATFSYAIDTAKRQFAEDADALFHVAIDVR